jgi:aryl-alcohol dehydrogenase-like predicted oxidoreductase
LITKKTVNVFNEFAAYNKKKSLSVAQIVLGYLTNQPFPVFPLIGPKTLPDLQESLGNAGAKLSQDDLFYLEHGEL